MLNEISKTGASTSITENGNDFSFPSTNVVAQYCCYNFLDDVSLFLELRMMSLSTDLELIGYFFLEPSIAKS